MLLIILQESLLKPNTSDIDADKLFLIILTSLNCFLALYHLRASVLKGFLPGFPQIWEESTREPFVHLRVALRI